jgi:hypothetical protein
MISVLTHEKFVTETVKLVNKIGIFRIFRNRKLDFRVLVDMYAHVVNRFILNTAQS